MDRRKIGFFVIAATAVESNTKLEDIPHFEICIPGLNLSPRYTFVLTRFMVLSKEAVFMLRYCREFRVADPAYIILYPVATIYIFARS